jgi:hypothetical protein
MMRISPPCKTKAFRNQAFSLLLGLGTAVTVLGAVAPAQAAIFSFSATINGNDYDGTLEFSGEGTGLSPLFTSNTKVTTYQGNSVDAVYFTPFSPPVFTVGTTTLDVTETGGMGFTGDIELDFGDLSPSSDALIDFDIFAQAPVTFTRIDSQPVPEPITLLGTAAAFGFGALFKRKRSES